MPLSVLLSILALEIILRIFLEIRERRIFGQKIPGFIFRCVPILNDLIPFSISTTEKPQDSHFKNAHEEAHKKLHHHLLRNLMKLCFFSFMVILIVIMLGEWQIGLIQTALWFHIALVFFRPLYHHVCWKEETEADKLAATQIGKNEAKKALSKLQQMEKPTSLLFAFLYSEHPPAYRRRTQII